MVAGTSPPGVMRRVFSADKTVHLLLAVLRGLQLDHRFIAHSQGLLLTLLGDLYYLAVLLYISCEQTDPAWTIASDSHSRSNSSIANLHHEKEKGGIHSARQTRYERIGI